MKPNNKILKQQSYKNLCRFIEIFERYYKIHEGAYRYNFKYSTIEVDRKTINEYKHIQEELRLTFKDDPCIIDYLNGLSMPWLLRKHIIEWICLPLPIFILVILIFYLHINTGISLLYAISWVLIYGLFKNRQIVVSNRTICSFK